MLKKIKEINKFYHLSHIDLDGYGSQVISNNLNVDIEYFNSNYGKEIGVNLTLILEKIDASTEDCLILITDLNLRDEEASFIDNEVAKRDNVSLLLLDHHATGKSVAVKYDWYYLNEEKSATRLTFEYFKELLSNKETLDSFSQIVNAYDLWKQEDKLFKLGKLLNFIVFETSFPFPKEIKSQKVDYIIFALTNIHTALVTNRYSEYELTIVDEPNNGPMSIQEIEQTVLPQVRLDYLKNKIPDDIFNSTEMIMYDKYNYFVYYLMKDMDFPVIQIDDVKFKVFYNINGGVFQNISHVFNDNSDGSYTACMNVLKTGKISMRSTGPESSKDVSKIGKKYLDGGGHVNAGGGSIPVKKEISVEDVHAFLKKLS